MNEEQLDRESVERCLGGDVDAFGELIDRYQRPVFRAVFHVVGSYEDAREVCQQAFMKAYEHLSTFDPNRRFFSWLYRVALNEAINFIHSRRSFEPIEAVQVDRGPSAFQSFEAAERRLQVREAVMSLDENYREVILLRHYFHCSYSEAAEVLHIPEKTVKSRLFAARQMLRDALTAPAVKR
jgi:RNA polymerase sigma-70 factor (ECF subfamily)